MPICDHAREISAIDSDLNPIDPPGITHGQKLSQSGHIRGLA